MDYRWTDKDPIIDICRTAIQQSGMSLLEISNKSGVTTGTLHRWLYGETRRPLHSTVRVVLRVCGVSLDPAWIATGKPVIPTLNVVLRAPRRTK